MSGGWTGCSWASSGIGQAATVYFAVRANALRQRQGVHNPWLSGTSTKETSVIVLRFAPAAVCQQLLAASHSGQAEQ